MLKKILFLGLGLFFSVQGIAQEIDVLLVLDNSQSTEEIRRLVAKNAGLLIGGLNANGSDWKLGVISVSENEAPLGGFTNNTAMAFGIADSAARLSTVASQSPTTYDIEEKTFAPVLRVISTQKKFFRREAKLAIVTATDAQEQSKDITPKSFLEEIEKELGHGTVVSVNGLFASPYFGCKSNEDPWDFEGGPYGKSIRLSKGMSFPLCGNALGTYMYQLGQWISH